MSTLINNFMKTIKNILEEIHLITEAAPQPEVGTDRPVRSSDIGGFGPNEMPLFNYKVLGAVAPDTQQQGEFIPGGNGLSIHRQSHEYLQNVGAQYGVNIGPTPGTPEAQILRQQYPQYKSKNLYVLNNIIKHRERTSEIYNRLKRLAIAPFADEHLKDYTDPYNHDYVETMEPNYDMTSQQQNVENQDFNDAADVGGF
jgi:hypothetical protein